MRRKRILLNKNNRLYGSRLDTKHGLNGIGKGLNYNRINFLNDRFIAYNINPSVSVNKRNSGVVIDEYEDVCKTSDDNDELEKMHMLAISDKINNRISSKKDDIFNSAFSYVEKQAVNYIRNSIGKSIDVYNFNSNSFAVEDIIVRYIRRYNKTNRKYYNKLDNKYRIVKDNSFIIPLDKYTFINIKSGILCKHGDLDFRNYDGCIEIYVFGKNYKYHSKNIEKILKADSKNIYFINAVPEENGYGNNIHRTSFYATELDKRTENTMFFSNNELKIIIDYLDNFIANDKMYKEKEIIYKTGLLLYGKPGTGKSTLVKLLANKYGRSIISVELSKIEEFDFSELSNCIQNDHGKYIVLFEDIDTVFSNLDRELDIDNKSAKVVNSLLQFLDSNSSPNDTIMIATTNHIDKLDEALLRDGRFDLKINIKPLNEKDAIKFAKSFGLTTTQANSIVEQVKKEENFDGFFYQSHVQNLIISKLKDKNRKEYK